MDEEDVVYSGEIHLGYDVIKYTDEDGVVTFDVQFDGEVFESDDYFDTLAEAKDWAERHGD
jgi:hypothetical protein